VIPYEKFPGLAPLFHDFRRGLPEFYTDPPTLEAAAERGRQLLKSGARARFPANAFRGRGAETSRLARALSEGRAVAVGTGHQVGLLTGPLFTLIKALDAIHLARELTHRGVPAAPVFWALTDDHDLQEIARTARPTPEGPQILVLEGADRQNRRPVGPLPIPEGIRGIVDAFRPDVRDAGGEEVLRAFAARSAPGTPYGDAFVETLLDLVDPDPLLVLDPLTAELRGPTASFFLEAVKREADLRATLLETEEKLRRAGKAVPASLPEGFSFFLIDGEGRRRVEDPGKAAARVESGEAWPSADVLTRPVLKSYLFPMAASVLGAGEIAYHAQSLPLFSVFGVTPPVLIPRTHVVLRGPAERRLARQLGLDESDLFSPRSDRDARRVPEAEEVERLARDAEGALEAVRGSLEGLEGSLGGAVDTARRKIAYQFEQLAERARKAAERKEGVAANRAARLDHALLPDGVLAERLYPPLVPMLAWGREPVGAALREAVARREGGAAVVDLGLAQEQEAHAG
jgi:bacillithiol synthase